MNTSLRFRLPLKYVPWKSFVKALIKANRRVQMKKYGPICFFDMKKFAKSLFLFPILVLMAACTGVAELERNETFDITITACSESRTSGTKTLLQSSGAVYWNPGDAMSLFFNEGTEGGSRFVSECTQVESVSTFKGSITNVSGGGEDFVGNGTFWGVYPYSQENMCDGESVTLPVRKVQDGLEDSFAIGFFPTVACSSGLELAFFNVCGGVKFSVWNEGIKSVKFKANGGEMLAGKVRVNFDEGNYIQFYTISSCRLSRLHKHS